MSVSRLILASPTDEHTGRLSDEVELYQRTYNTLLRSSGETALRVLESSHRAMGSSHAFQERRIVETVDWSAVNDSPGM